MGRTGGKKFYFIEIFFISLIFICSPHWTVFACFCTRDKLDQALAASDLIHVKH